MPDLVFASSSPYRRKPLTHLRLPFEGASSNIDESHRLGKSAKELVRRLSASRAEALAGRYPQHLVTSSDQVAILNDGVLGEPRTPEHAIQRLRDASGRSVAFLTGLALLNSVSRRIQVVCVPFTVHFRHLDRSRVRHYVEAERPLDCAGSFKVEGLGVSLFRATKGEDAISPVGLPLIRLVGMFLEEGVEVP